MVGELVIDSALVRSLLRTQLPEALRHLAAQPITPLGAGWHHSLFRVGADYVVRVPLSAGAAEFVAHEATWLHTSNPLQEEGNPMRDQGVAVPIPVFRGEAGPLLSWPWTLVPWIPGVDSTEVPVADRTPIAGPLARALLCLHREAPARVPLNHYRGSVLAQRRASVRDRWPAVESVLDGPTSAALAARWESAHRAPRWTGAPALVHGDLLPANIIIDRERLAGLINFHDIGRGDPAVDLSVAWTTFDAQGRRAFREVMDDSGRYDAHVWERAAGWAIVLVTAMMADPVSMRNNRATITHTLEAFG